MNNGFHHGQLYVCDMATLPLLGQVMFFNPHRGFGRIRSDELPQGVFVHFSAIDGESRVLIPHELVRFDYKNSPRGPRATQVKRLSPRLSGSILYVKGHRGQVASLPGGRKFEFEEQDLIAGHLDQVRPGVAVEFSPFETHLAKEIVVVDPRSPLERFARLENWPNFLAQLADRLQPEKWHYPGSNRGGYSVLGTYLQFTFARLQAENKIEQGRNQQGKPIAAFDTGLMDQHGQEVYALFETNQDDYRSKSHLPRPKWELSGFVAPNHPDLACLEHLPSRAYYFQALSQLIFDPTRPVLAHWEKIIQDARTASQAIQQLDLALKRGIKWATYDYQQVIPAFYHGEVVLLIPMNLSPKATPSLAGVLKQVNHRYHLVDLLSLEEAYSIARLLAPVRPGWLHHSQVKRSHRSLNGSQVFGMQG